jgi:hypothetical protein
VLSPKDRGLIARLLLAIAGALGSEPFTSRDLRECAGAAIVLAGLSVKQIGRLLARAEGHPVEGYLVERVGSEINVTLWRVLASVSKGSLTGTRVEASDSIDGSRRI